MTNPNTGRFTWHELSSSDPAAAAKFYSSLLGWTVKEMDMGPMGVYRMLYSGEQMVGGAAAAPPGVPTHWLSYIATEDCDAAAAKVTELGGKILHPPTTVPEMVRFAIAMDPQGAAFGILKNLGPAANTPPPEGPPAPGTFCWDELHTKDLDAAAKYYGALCGWTGKSNDGPMKYWHWQNQGKDIGGMMALMMPNVPPNWLAYIAVSDVEGSTKKVKELGGKVMMDTMDIEKVGKFSVVADPQGAVFSLFRSARV